MCSRMCESPAPRCLSSSTLPVSHHAWTLATGALWSSCTITVSPSCNVQIFAVTGGTFTSGGGDCGFGVGAIATDAGGPPCVGVLDKEEPSIGNKTSEPASEKT